MTFTGSSGTILFDLLIIAPGVGSTAGCLSNTVGSLQEQLVNLRITMSLLDTEPEIRDVRGAISLKRAWGRITFATTSSS